MTGSERGTAGAHDPVDLAAMRADVSAGALITDADVLAAHSQDRAPFCTAGRARALVRARSVEDVRAVMRFAHRQGVPVVPQGARTGLAGGANAVDGAILLDVSGMNRILNVDPVERTCTVEPGVVNQDLKDHVHSFGLAYPPDPGSVAISTIGGNVATDAGGLCCVKYGVTRDYVRRLRVVLADGELTTLGRPTAKGVAGLALSQLFIGSEGTLGIIVEIELDLVPALPPPVTAVALFPAQSGAAETVSAVAAAGYRLSMVEYLDRTTMGILQDYRDFGLPAESGAMLLVQSDGDGDTGRAHTDLQAFEGVAHERGASEVWVSDDPAESEVLVAARRAVNPAFEKFTHARGGGQFIDDVCLPLGALRRFFEELDRLAAQYPDVVIANSGHAGDGNMHPCVFFDAADATAAAHAQLVFDELMALGLELGGTITGEHGVGGLKRSWLARELDPVAQDLHLRVKQAFDPRGILNPGKMLADLSPQGTA
ncbi:FAD-binding oxidoreductase [Sediminivirga luteola]|uniref:FAD-linked oxidase n=1 Tax=Sediminivirga luteola TaxID=1774748 RepID=A0A8J2XL30_9MICO|nr:FAD-linked oxidase C-terminal domain-containing protein [Sediminivirga luteola]GGA18742.1 FAD-linked oxidase [Sediminivirga luteola]